MEIKYYAHVNTVDGSIGKGMCPCSGDNIVCIEITEEIYNDIEHYMYDGTDIVLDPDYEEKQAAKRRQELDALTLTPADVERALYRAKGMDFEDLKALIAQRMPNIDIKGLAIEFRAKDFYRGAEAAGVRLFDAVGQLLGYSPEAMDYLFLNKELPVPEEEVEE